MSLDVEFGGIDIYLFDQILRGRITERDRVFDAGCGGGRNLVYLMRMGAEVAGIDMDPRAIAQVRAQAAELAPRLPADNFRVESIQTATIPDGWATVVISSAVLHFANDDAEFDTMLAGTWRVVAPGGMLFCRLASTIGIEAQVRRLSETSRRYRLPDGSDRYLVDEDLLMTRTHEMGGRLLDPIKTTVVQNQRAMTTWVVERH